MEQMVYVLLGHNANGVKVLGIYPFGKEAEMARFCIQARQEGEYTRFEIQESIIQENENY